MAAEANISAIWRIPKVLSAGLTAATPVLEVVETRAQRRLPDL